MLTFVIALIVLVLGYVFYGKFIERLFGADPNRDVPAKSMADGVDYIAMPTWKAYMIQFLNIAGRQVRNRIISVDCAGNHLCR